MTQENLLLRGKNKYSQAGQDGLIEYVLSALQIRSGHFVEFGGADGIYLSNCRKLCDEGWSGVFIESDTSLFSKLRQNYKDQPSIACLNERIAVRGPQTLDKVLERHGLQTPITFLSIDIDGFDLEIFKSLKNNLPPLICLEGGMGPAVRDPEMPLCMIGQLGQSLSVIDRTVRSKGYRILCAFQDVFLIKAEYYPRFNVADSLTELYKNGYKYQPQYIPLYAQTLRVYHRRNPFLEYILRETRYSTYESAKAWRAAWQAEIAALIDSIPDSVMDQTQSSAALLEARMWSYSRSAVKTLFGYAPGFKKPIKAIESVVIRRSFK